MSMEELRNYIASTQPPQPRIGIYTAAVIRDAQGRYFIQHNRKRDQWVFPGGKPEPGESSFECLVRECREELGIEITKARYRGAYCAELENMEWVGLFFDVVAYEGTIKNQEPEKCAGTMWVPASYWNTYLNLPNPERNILQMAHELANKERDTDIDDGC